jgi:nucleoside-diphosphate-sugar epimerase
MVIIVRFAGSNYNTELKLSCVSIAPKSVTTIKILITGGVGFVGSNLSEKYVNDGHTVFALDNLSNGNLQNVRSLLGKPNFKFIKGDVRNKDLIFQLIRDCDVCIHLASIISVDQSIVDPYTTYETNVLSTLHILEACRLYDKKLVYASTSECYGQAQYSPMDERHPLDALHIYGSSKIAGDRLCFAYAKTFKMPVFIVRCFNLYGQNQKDSGYGGVISIFVKNVLQGKPCRIFGSGKQTRDYLHISDAVRAYDLVLNCKDESLWGVPINFATGKEHSIISIADMIVRKINPELEHVFVEPRVNEVKRLVGDISLARNRLGFVPKVKFEDGLSDYIQWTRDFKGEEWKLS